MSLPTCPSCEYAKGVCKKTGVEIRATSGCTYHTPRRISNADKYFRMASDYDIALFLAQVLDNCVIFGANGNCPDSCPMYRCCYDQKGDSIQEWLEEEAEPYDEEREYEAQVEATQYCEMSEPTYDPDTGAL